ncbi:hypothetical protein HZ326_3406 [Fusarium oxysporum f. sp. albedinis]|nr:hypothetical protein HZ326_3406 [Fusarium oxysporum f. sp. albedinis]
MRSVSYVIDPRGDIEVVLAAPKPIPRQDDDEEEDDSTIKMGTLDSLFYATTNPQEEDKEAEIRRRPTTRAARPANAIHLTGWDVKALATVLNIIHGQRSQVLRNVDFGFVTHIAVVAHHLKCVEAVQLYSELWLSTFEKHAMQYLNNVCLMWLFGSWVFPWKRSFRIAHNCSSRTTKGLVRIPCTIFP